MNKIDGRDILTIGCQFDPPRGGIAQVLYTYRDEVFEYFQFVANSGAGSKMHKLVVALYAYFRVYWLLLTNKQIHIVHIHTASNNSFKRSSWFVRLAKAQCRKVVLHIHGGGFCEYYKTNPEWILKMLNKADCIVALTDKWTRFYTDELRLLNVVTVNNIIPSPNIKKPQKEDGRVHLLFLGFIVEQKGIFDLLEVIKTHREEWKDRLMLHVGGDHEVEKLKEFINENGLEQIIQYEGWVSGEKKIELLNMMDAFILPSYVEGLPISILEALSYGKPVITTPVGGIPEVVNSDNGFLFSPGDKKEMGKIINEIIVNPVILRSKGINAKTTVVKNSSTNIVSTLKILYGRLMEGGGRNE